MTATDTERLQFMQDMQAALSHTPKSISPKYFYDQAGSALFDRICDLPEYYPTRTEVSILQSHAADMAAHMGEHADIIEFGAGSLQKIRLLLNAASKPARYVPMDISGLHLQTASALLKKEFPALQIQPMVADYTSAWKLPAALPQTGKRLAFFPGSTIGNFSPQQAQTFFSLPPCPRHWTVAQRLVEWSVVSLCFGSFGVPVIARLRDCICQLNQEHTASKARKSSLVDRTRAASWR